MKNILIILFITQSVICHDFNPNQTKTIFYLERENQIVEVPVTVSWTTEKFDPNKDRSDYIDMTEVSNLFFEENDAQQ